MKKFVPHTSSKRKRTQRGTEIHSSLTQLKLSLSLKIKMLPGETTVGYFVLSNYKRLKIYFMRTPKMYDNSTFL